MGESGRRGRGAVVEVLRLTIVLTLTALGYQLGPGVADLLSGEVVAADPIRTRLVSSVLGALLGYVVGGMVGRGLVTGVDVAEQRLRRIEAAVVVAGALGAATAGMVAFALLWPVLVLPYKAVTVPAAMAVLATVLYAGGRLGASRGGDLLRYIGARGRVEVAAPSRGAGTKVVDSSALVDGRLVDVARAGFLDGTLVIPRFVLSELQGLADAEDPRRRAAGRRGLDLLRTLQEERVVTVEVSDEDAPEVVDVDAKLAAVARSRGAALVTVDANLARVAEISGIRVLNLHVLAEALRPPVLPGDRVTVTIVKEGREAGQGVGYLPDGTMVVVERAVERLGRNVGAEVTSLLQTRNGRMVFATLVEERA